MVTQIGFCHAKHRLSAGEDWLAHFGGAYGEGSKGGGIGEERQGVKKRGFLTKERGMRRGES